MLLCCLLSKGEYRHLEVLQIRGVVGCCATSNATHISIVPLPSLNSTNIAFLSHRDTTYRNSHNHFSSNDTTSIPLSRHLYLERYHDITNPHNTKETDIKQEKKCRHHWRRSVMRPRSKLLLEERCDVLVVFDCNLLVSVERGV